MLSSCWWCCFCGCCRVIFVFFVVLFAMRLLLFVVAVLFLLSLLPCWPWCCCYCHIGDKAEERILSNHLIQMVIVKARISSALREVDELLTSSTWSLQSVARPAGGPNDDNVDVNLANLCQPTETYSVRWERRLIEFFGLSDRWSWWLSRGGRGGKSTHPTRSCIAHCYAILLCSWKPNWATKI